MEPRRLTLGALLVACLALAPVARHDVGASTTVLPVALAILAVCDLLTGALLLQRFVGHGSSRLLGLATAYLCAGMLVAADGLPGIDGTAGWAWAALQGGFPLAVALAAWGGTAGVRRHLADPALRRDRAALWAVALSAIVAVALLALLPHLPDATHRGLAPLVVPAGLLALALTVRRGRRGDLEPWLPLVVLCSLAGSLATVAARSHAQVGWYAGLAFGVAASAVLLAVLVAEVGRLHRRLETANAGGRDPLTGAPTRASVLAVAEELQRTRAAHVPMAVALVDVDRLRAVNNRFGHLAGDAALRVVATRARHALRDDDLLGRCGGGHFVLVLPDTDLVGAALAAERVLEAIRATPAWGGPRELHITASAGVAPVGRGERAVDHALSEASTALDAAKSAGRDRVAAAGAPAELFALPVVTRLPRPPAPRAV